MRKGHDLFLGGFFNELLELTILRVAVWTEFSIFLIVWFRYFFSVLFFIWLIFRVNLIVLNFIKLFILLLLDFPIFFKDHLPFLLISIYEFLLLQKALKSNKLFEILDRHFLIICHIHISTSFNLAFYNEHWLFVFLISNDAIDNFFLTSCDSHKWRYTDAVNALIGNKYSTFFMWIGWANAEGMPKK